MTNAGQTVTKRRGGNAIAALALGLGLFAAAPADAVIIELKDVASDRVERQRAEAIGQLPLPGTPNIAQLGERLAAKKMAVGNHMLIRVFKASSELEVWLKTGGRYELFATYPICNWSGTLGPKISEGDKQSPEGVYTVTSRQLHLIGRHPRSLNLGFPNALDKQMSRTGSYILIHGGCGSVGCFAMTNPVIEEVFSLATAALTKGAQDAVQVHVFPFRMTEERLKAYALNEWYDFWRNLKDVHDSFERTHTPPRVTVCEGRYWVEDNPGAEEVASQGPLAVCAVSRAEAASQTEPDVAHPEVAQPWWPQRAMLHPSLVPSRAHAPMVHSPRERQQTALSLARFNQQRWWQSLRAQMLAASSEPPQSQTKQANSQVTSLDKPLAKPLAKSRASLQPSPRSNLEKLFGRPAQSSLRKPLSPSQLSAPSRPATTTKKSGLLDGHLAAAAVPPLTPALPPPTTSCDLNRASCRHHMAGKMVLYRARLALEARRIAEDARRANQRVRVARQ